MRNHYEENPKCGRFHFELSLTPDFDALVKLRRPKNIEKVKIDDDMKTVKNNKKDAADKITVIKSLNPSEVDAISSPRRYKKFKAVTVMPELIETIKIADIKPITYTKGLCYPKRYKKFKAVTVMPELLEEVSGSQKIKTAIR